ncbi:MAG: undecaprenyldiphospho-muramoylpentapeptide beta-N-acetylglucosaminyltransferase [Deltaproteobacteria bacterium]|nr:undecaprenyldiphospho-muramoylpentapeptide beta-N-acetylglucosaminyltransferase [Deltaproteobacteria bacterium]
MKILFAGGGTGGHLFTGIALAERLTSEDEVLFVGTSYGLENEIVPRAGYRLEKIEVKPLKGKGLKARLKALFEVPASLFQSYKLLRKERPQLVIGIGGYASGPVILMARFMGIKTAIVEQNSMPGFSNRILGKFVHRVFIAFEQARDFFSPSKTLLTGNPVRKAFLMPPLPLSPSPLFLSFTLLILGGSQGAHSVNEAMVEAAVILNSNSELPQIRIIHQTGKLDFEKVKEAYAQKGISAEVFEFIQNPKEYYSQADLVISRSGAGSVSELQILGKASILIPYPYATDDHQRFNAMELVDKGAARLILNPNLNGGRLASEILELMKHPEKIQGMSEAAQRLAKPQAAEKILEECRKILEKST